MAESISPNPNANYGGILPCGGRGTRLEPLSGDRIPKSLFPVGGVELIRYSIDVLKPEIVGQLVFAVDHKAEDIRQWVDDADPPHSVDYSEQTEPGVLGAITAGVQQVRGSGFVACNTDEIRLGLDLEDVVGFHESHSTVATMVTTYSNRLNRHRVIEAREQDGLITGTQLKPEKTDGAMEEIGLVNTGFLIMDTSAVDLFDPQHGHDWGGIIDPLCEAGQLSAYIDPQIQYFNVGTPDEYNEAEAYLKQNPRD